MKALTLWQPWLWAMQHAGKALENRPWTPPSDILRGCWFALHAGAKFDEDGANTIESISRRPVPDTVTQSAGVGVARVESVVVLRDASAFLVPGGTLLVDLRDQAPWLFGPFGWILERHWVETPIPCRGFQKFWQLPAVVQAKLDRQLGDHPARFRR